ncbi:MAG: tyrosine-type recombinase/integrase [Bacteroidota bacterium]
MPRKPQERYFQGVLLPDNLYPDDSGRPGYWRYRRPDRTFKRFIEPDTHEACAIAEENNAARSGTDRSTTLYAVNQYINYAEKLRPGLLKKESWYNRKNAMRGFAKEYPTRTAIMEETVWRWWDTLTHSQQGLRRSEFRRMWAYWLRKNYSPTQKNPFDKDMLQGKERPTVERERLSVEDYWRIYHHAPSMGYNGLQVAMGIALTTMLRRSDIVALQAVNVQSNRLELTVHKSLEQRGQIRAARLHWTFDKHPELADLVQRGLAYGARSNCPYVVSHKPLRHNTSKAKTHSWQILPNALSKQFAKVRDDLKIGGEHPPTFHEVRSTGSYLLAEQGEEITDIMESMAHSEVEMTKLYHDGHPLPSEPVLLRVKDFGGEF